MASSSSSLVPGISLAEHLGNNVKVLVLLALVDRLIISTYLSAACKREKDVVHGRWFFTHAFANLLVVLTSLGSVAAVLRDPFNAMVVDEHRDISLFGSGSIWPLTIINSVHVYHMLGGFGLSSADYFHHGLFIPTLGFPGQIFAFGAGANWQAFFISGLPGGIDYFVLGLIRCGLANKMFEKRLSANLNVWLRNPGILSATFILYQSLVYGKVSAPWFVCALQLILPPYNAMYYCKQSVANYAVHYMLGKLNMANRVKQRISITLGGSVMDWEDALGEMLPKKMLAEPQRGS